MLRHALTFVGIAALLPLQTSTAQGRDGAELGKQTYETFCIVCHGTAGVGSPVGASLIAPTAKSKSDSELLDIITNGVPGTSMAAYGRALSEDQLIQIVQYVRELQRARDTAGGPSEPAEEAEVPELSPDAISGEALFNGEAGCIQCHSYRERGGSLGPDLTTIAAQRTPEELLAAVLHPSAHIHPGFQSKEIMLSDGTRVEGRVCDETPTQIQIATEGKGSPPTYLKKDISKMRDGRNSLMPDDYARRLTRQEQDQIVAFLETLK